MPASPPAHRTLPRHRRLPAVLIAVVALVLPPAWADRDDHERARQAVTAGEVLPLRTVLERLERDHPGQVLEVELDREDGRWVYEIKLLQTNGQLLKLEIDARTAETLRSKQREDRGRHNHR